MWCVCHIHEFTCGKSVPKLKWYCILWFLTLPQFRIFFRKDTNIWQIRVRILNRMETLIACWLTPHKYISAISENHTDAALLPSKETVFHIPKNALHIMSIITNLNIFSIDYNYIWNRIWKNSHFIVWVSCSTKSVSLPKTFLAISIIIPNCPFSYRARKYLY